jgi:D-3-phosphoglycerate dehydrogenase
MRKIVSFFGSHNEIFDELNKKAKDYAGEKGLEYEWVPEVPFSREDVIHHLNNADAGIIDVEPYGEETFPLIGDRCRLLVRFGVGFDKVDLKAATKYGIAIARTTGANTNGVAEMAVSLMLATSRQLFENQKIVRQGEPWSQRGICNEIVDGVIGIVGFGMIGQTVAKLVSGFGCRVLAYDPYINKESTAHDNVEFVSLETLFRESDAITVHVAYNSGTHMMINKKLLELMKNTAVLVNTSRGNIVDEDALFQTLKAKKIRGAALDVFGKEPLPVTSPLMTLDNIILTPHVSSQTVESLWRIYAMAIDIISDFYAGKPVRHILNSEVSH